jgi:hypothetical protein
LPNLPAGTVDIAITAAFSTSAVTPADQFVAAAPVPTMGEW